MHLTLLQSTRPTFRNASRASSARPTLRASLVTNAPEQQLRFHRFRNRAQGPTDPTGSGGAEESVFEDLDEVALDPEDDWVVPGGASDSLSPNTPLGKAIRSACDELEHLNKLEMDQLQQAQGLLQKLGFKGDIFQGQTPVSLGKDSLDLEGLGEDSSEREK